MYMIDFEFNEEALSDHGMAFGFISSPEETTPLGSPMTLNTVKVGDINRITSVQYDEPITKTFSIIKSKCSNNGNMIFTDDEIYEVSTWLQSREYCKFKPIYDDGSFSDIHFYGRFDIQAIYVNSDVVGFELTFTADAPYGYGEEEEATYEVDNTNNGVFRVFNDSQELGYLYFKEFIIECGANGSFRMTNSNDVSIETGQAYSTRIDNCLENEIINIKCQERIITSSSTIHTDTLFNDFNWNYPRLNCDYVNPLNVFTVDVSEMPSAKITVKFSPIRKVGVI